MIKNKLESSIITAFQKNPHSSYSINELSKKLKKAYPYINKKINSFIDDGVINKLVIGHSYQCYLNYASEKTKLVLSLNALYERDELLKKNLALNDLIKKFEELSKYHEIYSAVLIDKKIIVISENIDFESQKIVIREITDFLKSKKNPEIQIEFLSKKLYLELFLNDEKISENLIVLCNITAYFDLFSQIMDQLVFRSMFNKSNNMIKTKIVKTKKINRI